VYFVRADGVDWAEADGNHVRLHVGAATHTIREPMRLAACGAARLSAGARRAA
jgi:hypothetical protein